MQWLVLQSFDRSKRHRVFLCPLLVQTEDPFTLSIRPGPTFGEKGAPSGALTGKGVKQMLELGRTLRRRYVDGESGDARVHTKLLTGNPDEIYTRSTAIQRTVQSAQVCPTQWK